MLLKLKRTLTLCCNFDEKIYKLLTSTDRIIVKKFCKNKIAPNTILITDLDACHGEILPGLIDYCLKLGYKVEVLLTKEKTSEKPLEMYKNKIKNFSAPWYLFQRNI